MSPFDEMDYYNLQLLSGLLQCHYIAMPDGK